MITYRKNEIYEIKNGVPKYLIDIACLSTDTKPSTNIVTGSLALEVNTGDIYAFDEVSGNWTKING